MAKQRPKWSDHLGSFSMFGKTVNWDRFWVYQFKESLVDGKKEFTFDEKNEVFLTVEGSKQPVIVFPWTTDGKVVAVRHFRYGKRGFMVLELPGGGTEDGCNWKKTAERELYEETGYSVAPENLIPLFPETSLRPEDCGIYLDPALGSTRFLPVLARECELQGEPCLESTEYVEVLDPMDRETWKKKIYEGKLVDAKSIVTTFLALKKLGLSCC